MAHYPKRQEPIKKITPEKQISRLKILLDQVTLDRDSIKEDMHNIESGVIRLMEGTMFAEEGNIVLPHVKLLKNGGIYTAFHTMISRDREGKFNTILCDRKGKDGFCLGHPMSRGEFIDRFIYQEEGSEDRLWQTEEYKKRMEKRKKTLEERKAKRM